MNLEQKVDLITSELWMRDLTVAFS